jgi:hypothetical protein
MKKNSIWYTLPALVLCISAFFTPVTAYAKGGGDTTPPVISAELSGDTLHIEASDEDSGVDAVYIGTKRINYRVDHAIDVEFEDYAGTKTETVGVYAIDFAGNQSEVVEVKNPYYEGTADTEAENTAEPNPFTPAGQATVLDNATDGDGKEFYTFVTPEENVFYLVIDNQRDSENVYFLNAVTEDDLAALAEKGEKSGESESAVPEVIVCTCADKCEAGMVNTSCPVCKNDLSACTGKEQAPPETEEPAKAETKKGNGGAFIFVLLAALIVGGAGYYFKIYKPKHDLDDAEDLEDILEDDETEVNEDSDGQDMPAGEGMETYMDAAAYDDYPEDDDPDREQEQEGMEE